MLMLRKITPAQGGRVSSLSPAEGNSLGNVRISNVRPNGTFLLVAPARQSIPQWGGGVRDIDRLVKYLIVGDLATYPQPVISAGNLFGYIFPDYNGEVGRNEEFPAGVTDITDEGTVLGYTSSWPFFYAPTLMWGSTGGSSPRWFDFDFFRTLGTPTALDRNGYVIGEVGDLNAPQLRFTYDAPLTAITRGPVG